MTRPIPLDERFELSGTEVAASFEEVADRLGGHCLLPSASGNWDGVVEAEPDDSSMAAMCADVPTTLT